MSIDCFWALGAINYKNNKATTCPRQWDPLVDLSDPLPSNILNSSGFMAVRLLLSNGIWPKGCKTCEEFEKDKYYPYRLHHPLTDEMKNNYNLSTGEVDRSNLRHIEFRFSNACNFSCMHCSAAFSSGWANMLKTYEVPQTAKDAELEQLIKDNQFNNYSLNEKTCNSIFKDLCENFPKLEMIDVAGGEPLYQKQVWNLFEKMKDHPNISNIAFNMTSNFNVDGCDYIKLSEKLKIFGKSKIRISVDGGSNIYSYFRSGEWDKLVNNINTFREHNNFTTIEATCTTSVYQMLDIKNVIQDMASLNVNKLHTSFVQFPKYLNPAIIKHKFKDKINQDLQELIDEFSYNENISDICRKIYDYFNKKECIEKDYKRFILYVNEADKLQHKSFNNYFKKFKIDFDSSEINYYE